MDTYIAECVEQTAEWDNPQAIGYFRCCWTFGYTLRQAVAYWNHRDLFPNR